MTEDRRVEIMTLPGKIDIDEIVLDHLKIVLQHAEGQIDKYAEEGYSYGRWTYEDLYEEVESAIVSIEEIMINRKKL